MKKINVSLKENPYSILIGSSIISGLNDEINKLKLYENILIVMDGNVAKYHSAKIKEVFKNSGKKIKYYNLKPGETSKSYKELNNIYSFLLENGYGRDTLLISIGGGVTGDLAGYAAATYMRGIQLIHIPTTLLAAVDSAIGGKTGINFQKKKNMVGAFYQPRLVVIDTVFFKTLQRKEQTSGIGEIIKYGYLADKTFFSYLNDNVTKIYDGNEKVIEEVIIKSAGIKAAVVSQDEKEIGIRKILNLGHTFAHGLETDLNFKVKHGEAVIAGVVAALYLSADLGLLNKDKLDDYLSLPLKIKMPRTFQKFNTKNVLQAMLHDKKNRNGKIKFVLPAEIGKMILDVEASKNAVISSLQKVTEVLNY